MLKPWNDDRLAANGCAVRENFQSWFESSKVVDDAGKPRVVYHGTNKIFTFFDPDKSFRGVGFQFADTKVLADNYAGKDGQVIAAYLKLERPYIVDVTERAVYEDSLKTEDELSGGDYYPDTALDWFHEYGRSEIKEAMTSGEYDGYIIREGGEDAVLGVLNPEQIKSATGNSGLYLRDNPSLTDDGHELTLLQAHQARIAVQQIAQAKEKGRAMLKPWNDDRLAANGRAVHENFQSWFESSKVVDIGGLPLVVYHATESGRIAENMGIDPDVDQAVITNFYDQSYFSANPHEALSYAMGEKQLYPVYLSIKNPYHTSDYDEFAQAYAGHADALQHKGFDGIIFTAKGEPNQYLTFVSEQIKSAIGNSGLFSKNSLSMTDHDDALILDNARKAKVIIDEISRKSDMNAAKSNPGEGFVGRQPGEPVQLNVPGFASFSVSPQEDRSVNFSMTAKVDGSLYFSSLRLTAREDGTPKLVSGQFETFTGKSVRAKANAKLEDLMDGAREAALSWANEFAIAPVSAGALNLNEMLFHATYEQHLESIRTNGLGNTQLKNWDASENGQVYLATEIEIARSYAECSDEVPEEWLDNIIVLSIDIKRLDKSRLKIDTNVIDNDGSTLQYEGVIPWSAIRLIDRPEAHNSIDAKKLKP